MNRRPEPHEHSAYMARYVALVPDGDITSTLEALAHSTIHLLGALDDARASFRYADGKWSVREVIGHLIDCERVFAYRALRIARGDTTPLAGFDENAYMPLSGYDQRSLRDVLEEFARVRAATVALLRGLPPDAWSRSGIASNNAISVRALAWAIAGHEIHHVAILRDKYLIA